MDPQHTVDMALGVFAHLNRGRAPSSPWDWARVARRMGVRIRYGITTAPFYCHAARAIYLPRARRREDLTRWLAHECTEALWHWAGEPPYRTPITPHDLARAVEDLCPTTANA